MENENPIEEAKLMQSIEANDKLETIGKNTEASLLVQSELKDTINELKAPLDAIVANTIKEETQKVEIMGAEIITIKGAKGDKGDSPSKEELTSLIEPLIPSTSDLIAIIEPLIPAPIKGDDGDDYVLTNEDKTEIASLIEVPIVEKVIEKTETIIEKPITIDKTKTIVKEVAKYEDASTIAEKLNTLVKEIDFKVIKNFPDFNKGGNGIGYIREASDVNITNIQNNDLLKWNGTAWVNVPASSLGGVSSVSNSDGTLTISPTTGAVVASLNLGHANTWIGQQTFSTSAPIFSTMTAGSVLFAGTSGLLSEDNTNFFWDDTLDILKLGGGTPTYTLANTQSMAMTKAIAGFYLPFAGQNTDNGTTSSTDITLSNNLGTDTTNYLDIGINSSTNTDPLYTGFSAGSGYMYNQSGDIVLATASAKSINFLTGGTLTANIRGSINSIGTWSITPATITGSAATNALSITQTWNTSGAPTALLLNVTNTASGAGSKLFDFQTGSVSRLSLSPGGLLQFGNTGTIGVQSSSTNPVIYEGTNVTGMTSGNGDLMLSGRQGFGIGFQTSTSGATALRMAILGNGDITMTSGGINPITATGTNNNGSVQNIFRNNANSGTTATTVGLVFQTDINTQRALIEADRAGSLFLYATTTKVLGFSTTTATFTDAINIAVGTTTGTKIGTATTQKLGFFNATPIVQPANTVAIDDVLVNLGLRAGGGSANFTGDITAPNLASGTYTPTLTNTTNVSSSTAYVNQYMRVGNVVTVSGKVTIDPTATGAVVLEMSLPVASNFTAEEQCGGACICDAALDDGVAVAGDVTNNTASFHYTAVNTASQAYHFTFTYLVV